MSAHSPCCGSAAHRRDDERTGVRSRSARAFRISELAPVAPTDFRFEERSPLRFPESTRIPPRQPGVARENADNRRGAGRSSSPIRRRAGRFGNSSRLRLRKRKFPGALVVARSEPRSEARRRHPRIRGVVAHGSADLAPRSPRVCVIPPSRASARSPAIAADPARGPARDLGSRAGRGRRGRAAALPAPSAPRLSCLRAKGSGVGRSAPRGSGPSHGWGIE